MVWFKKMSPYRYRVFVNVTVPELKEFREYHVDFRSFKKAKDFYFKMVKGADFYPPEKTKYQSTPNGPDPW